MNQNILIGVAALIVIGAIGFFIMNKDGAPADEMANTENSAMTSNPRTMKDLIAMQGDAKCTFKSEDDTTITEGTSYISNGRVRVDGTTTDKKADAVVTMNSIIDGGFVYAWSSAAEQGIKMAIPDETVEVGAEADSAIDLNQEYEYQCNSWEPNESMFELPTDITFMTMAGVMPEGMVEGAATTSMEEQDKEASCAACDMAPDEDSKAQCKAAFQCQ